jgi:HPt (histidine-containing phosphotransfer) domain-containing protein
MALAAKIETGDGRCMVPGPPFDRPVDLVHLARYTLGNRSLEREVLRLFCTQSSACLQRLKDAQADTDWADAAHTIKGSARSIGAWRVAKIAEAAEALCGEGRQNESASVVCELERLIGEVNSYIDTLLAEAGPNAA